MNVVSALDIGLHLTPAVTSGFRLEPPTLFNRDFIPRQVADAMIPAWETGYFPARPIYILKLSDVTVAAEGIVIDKNGSIVKESITQHSLSEIELAYRQYVYAKELNQPEIETPHVLCVKRGAENYGHWLIEMLPKAVLASRELEHMPLKFIVPRAQPDFRQVIHDSLSASGIQLIDAVELPIYPTRYRELLIVDGLSDHGAYMSPIITELLYNIIPHRINPGKKIYVTRNGQQTRQVDNELEITRYMQSKGFDVVDPSILTFSEQRAIFERATHIVGVMGAALANAVFCKKNTSIIVLAPDNMPDTFFWFLSGLKQLNYVEVRCKPAESRSNYVDWNSSIFVDCNQLSKILETHIR